MKKILLLLTITSFTLIASVNKLQTVESDVAKTWWLENGKAPLFSMVLYLGDGSFHDPANKSGLSAASLDLAFEGTSKYSEEEISTFFDNYGASFGSDVKHEYTSFYLSGLVEDIEPLVKMVCHIFQEASYPQEKLSSFKKKLVAEMDNLATSPEGIAERVFRKEALKASASLATPSSGIKKDLLKLNKNDLQKTLNYLTNKVERRIYLTGSDKVTKIPQILKKECGWEANPSFSRRAVTPAIKSNPKKEIIFVPIKKSNQAQIRIGRLLDGPASSRDQESLALLKNYLAGAGFISELFTELRVKRGLTYTVRAYADMQSQYGRSGIGTFTKNERITEMLSTIKMILGNLNKGKFNKERLELVRKNLKGGYLFAFEQDENLLQNIMYLHHIGKDESELYSFPDKVAAVSAQSLRSAMNSSFDWNDMTIVIVGDKSLQSKLKKFGRVKVVDWKDYL